MNIIYKCLLEHKISNNPEQKKVQFTGSIHFYVEIK